MRLRLLCTGLAVSAVAGALISLAVGWALSLLISQWFAWFLPWPQLPVNMWRTHQTGATWTLYRTVTPGIDVVRVHSTWPVQGGDPRAPTPGYVFTPRAIEHGRLWPELGLDQPPTPTSELRTNFGVAVGWPALSWRMSSRSVGGRAWLRTGKGVSGAFVLETLLDRPNGWWQSMGFLPLHPFLPYRPIWSGLAINTAFYGVIIWCGWTGLAGLRAWRRRRRFSRGFCPKCRYPLVAGLTSKPSPVAASDSVSAAGAARVGDVAGAEGVGGDASVAGASAGSAARDSGPIAGSARTCPECGWKGVE